MAASTTQWIPTAESNLVRLTFGCMEAGDWLLVAALCVAFTATCVLRSHTRLFWSDELYGARVVGAASFAGVLRGWYQGADGGGVLYYLLARLWVTVFGFSELTLRLFSTAGMCVALALSWAIVRRFSSTLVVALSVGLVFLSSTPVLWQEVNGRFYGLFLACAALASLLFLVAAESPLTPLLLTATSLAHLALVGSHILGCVYSVCLLLGLVLLDWVERRGVRWPLYAAASSGLLVLPLSYHAIHSSSAIATKAFWTQKPPAVELLRGLATYGRLTALLLVSACVLALLRIALRRVRQRRPAVVASIRRSGIFLAGALIAGQFVLFAKSQTGISVYADRYLLPVTIATALLLAWCMAQILPQRFVFARTTAALTALSALALAPLCVYGLSRRINYELYPRPGYPQRVTALIPPGAPVMTTMPEFTLLSRYDFTRPYLFMVDWSYDLDPRHPAFDDWDARLMENWRRAGYGTDRILPCGDLFSRYTDLYLLLDFQREPWFNDRMLHNPDFEVHKLADNHEWVWVALWSVHRRQNGPPPC